MGLNVTIVSGIDGLLSVEGEWRSLARFDGNGGFETSFESCLVTARHRLPDPGALRTVLVRSAAGVPLAVVPLVERQTRVRKIPVLQLSLPPDPDRPGAGFPAAPPEAWPASTTLVDALADAMDGPPSLLMLGPLEEGAASWTALEAQGARMVSAGAVRWIDTTDGDGDPLEEVAGKFRRNLRRRWRILESDGEPAFIVHRGTDEVMDALEAFLRIEQAGWKGRSNEGNAILDSPGRLAHARNTVRDLAQRDACEIHAVTLDGEVVASHVCFRGADSMYVFKTAYDESFSRVSPGHHLLHGALVECRGRPDLRRLVGGTEVPWWEPWGPTDRRLWRMYAPLGGLAPRLAYSLLPASQG